MSDSKTGRDDTSLVQLSLRVERGLRQRLKTAAAAKGVTMEHLLHRILTRSLKKKPRAESPETATTSS